MISWTAGPEQRDLEPTDELDAPNRRGPAKAVAKRRSGFGVHFHFAPATLPVLPGFKSTLSANTRSAHVPVRAYIYARGARFAYSKDADFRAPRGRNPLTAVMRCPVRHSMLVMPLQAKTAPNSFPDR